jgi:hypothetical protein
LEYADLKILVGKYTTKILIGKYTTKLMVGKNHQNTDWNMPI